MYLCIFVYVCLHLYIFAICIPLLYSQQSPSLSLSPSQVATQSQCLVKLKTFIYKISAQLMSPCTQNIDQQKLILNFEIIDLLKESSSYPPRWCYNRRIMTWNQVKFMVQSTLKHTYISRRIENFILSLMFWGQNNDYDTVWLCVACFEGRGDIFDTPLLCAAPHSTRSGCGKIKGCPKESTSGPPPTNCQITFHYKCHLIWFHVLWQNINLFHNLVWGSMKLNNSICQIILVPNRAWLSA